MRASPAEKMEELVTFPLEAEINTLDGLRWIYSETTVGVSAIYVELDKSTLGNRVDQMWDKVRSRVERVPMPDPSVTPVVIDDFGYNRGNVVEGLLKLDVPITVSILPSLPPSRLAGYTGEVASSWT